MIRRLGTLIRFFMSDFARSTTGIVALVFSIAYYVLFFQGDATDPNHYTVVIGVFGALASFVLTLVYAHNGNRAAHYPLIMRLRSRIEYLAAILLSAVITVLILQFIIAILALIINQPGMGIGRLLEVPPIWVSISILTSTIALHATDLATKGWSRVVIFGGLAIVLLTQGDNSRIARWFADLLRDFSRALSTRGWVGISQTIGEMAQTLTNNPGDGPFRSLFGLLFWPMRSLLEALTAGEFSQAQALAPALLLVYATILFLLAADFFSDKDLFLNE